MNIEQELARAASSLERALAQLRAQENPAQVISEIRQLHRRGPGTGFHRYGCIECLQPWPCRTIRAVDKLGPDGDAGGASES